MIDGELELTPYCEWCMGETSARRKGRNIEVLCKNGCGYRIRLLEDEYSDMLWNQGQDV